MRQPAQAHASLVLQGRFQALLLLRTREDSLRIPILSAGDGRARCARRRALAPLGAGRPRCDGAHGISQSSHRRRAARVSRQVPSPGHPGRWNGVKVVRTWLLPFPNRQDVRAHAELQFVLRLLGDHGTVHGASRMCDRHLSAVAGWLSADGGWLGASGCRLFSRFAIFGRSRWPRLAWETRTRCMVRVLGRIAGFLYRSSRSCIVVVTAAFKDVSDRGSGACRPEKIFYRGERRGDWTVRVRRPGSGCQQKRHSPGRISF